MLETARLRGHQIRRPTQTEQEAEGESLLRDRYTQDLGTSTHCCSYGLSRDYRAHTSRHGVL